MTVSAEVIKDLGTYRAKTAVTRTVRIKADPLTHNLLAPSPQFYSDEANSSAADVGSVSIQPWIDGYGENGKIKTHKRNHRRVNVARRDDRGACEQGRYCEIEVDSRDRVNSGRRSGLGKAV